MSYLIFRRFLSIASSLFFAPPVSGLSFTLYRTKVGNSRMKTLQVLVVGWLLGISLARVYSQPFPMVADNFGIANGLDATVRDMAQDEEGFYWLATNKGLYRFDGINATKIHLPVPDSLAKRTDNCYDLSLDLKNQLIWVGTDLGLLRYHLRTGAVRHFNPKDFYEEKDRQL